ncbi:TetR/AcrR family transcriptional regulator [Alcanivorax marinus]|uniref:TetR/AcrR family transcriptional regulator n=1 Tax=Alloalcanivorax marinus TaxID=1177169 RepID=A0A9Q3UR80_9GAMM|nr:TetR/AcrR family transcriptional regulator [Alloalcanivorax marinus]MCC4310119.1 TetR/AcrR family transcriptional regulator [Alloalcanivorax marinus]MCU5787974.1 TetR family transcriptional regulator [Alloalcanivorax marinus]
MQRGPDDLDAIRQVVNQVLEAHAEEEGGQRSQARAEILIHSMHVFAQRGLARTTVQHLLDAAKVSRRTFYKYFRNKMDVLEHIYRIFIDNMLLHFHQEMRQARSVRAIIHNTTKVYFDYHLSMGPVINLMMEEARSSGSALAPHRERAQRIAAQVVTAEIGRLTGRQLDPLVLRTMLWILENYSLYIFENGSFSAERLEECQRVMIGIAEAVVLGGEASPELLEARPG